MSRQQSIHHGLALTVLSGFALLVTAPAMMAPATRALGNPATDTWNHVWGYAWVGRTLSRGELPLRTELLHWPSGGALWFIDSFGAALTSPIEALWGPVVAYNAYALFCFALAGIGAYALALYETRSIPAALTAGICFEATPHLLAQAHNGISESLAIGWLPLALLATRHALARPGPARGALSGLAIATCALANWYYGLFAVLGAAGFWCVAPFTRGRPPLRTLAGAGLAAVATTAALLFPPLLVFRGTLGATDALVTRDPGFVWKTLIHHNMTDLVTFFRPGRFYSPDLAALWHEDLIVVVYIGWALLIPALAVLATRRGRRAHPWLVMAASALALTLGPFLYVNGRYVEVAGGWIPLPFLLLYKVIPLFSRLSHAYRFTLGIALGLSLAAAWTVRASEERWGPRGALLLALVLASARTGEALLASPAVFPVPAAEIDIPGVYRALPDDDDGALLDLPASLQVLDRSRYTLYQTQHGHPIPYALNDPTPPFLAQNRFTRYLLELERSRVALLPARIPVLDLLLARELARATGLRWIVVHTDAYPPAQAEKILQFLDLMATTVAEEDGAKLYRLDQELPTGRAGLPLTPPRP